MPRPSTAAATLTPVIDADDVIRLRPGYVTVPDDHPTHAGERLMVCAYLVRHPDGLFLFDTGIGSNEEVEEVYRPVRWGLEGQLRRLGTALEEVKAVANCHLHFDHSGGNSLFGSIPIYAQRIEHQTAGTPDYTIPGIAEFPGARYELLDGEAEPLPGLRLIPTPGHTEGHQSLLVDTRQGTVLLAGQSFNSASEFASAWLERELAQAGLEADARYPAWMDRVAQLDPWRVLFAHDTAIWERTGPIPQA